jgi:hypothetical protein
MPSAYSLWNPLAAWITKPPVRPTTFPTKPQGYDLKFKDGELGVPSVDGNTYAVRILR